MPAQAAPASAPAHVLTLVCEPLTAEAFRPYGDVIEVSPAATHYPINEGYAERYHDLACLDTTAEGGRPLLSIFRAKPRSLPLRLSLIERHCLSSQSFMPLTPQRFLVVVGPAGPAPDVDQLRCFLAEPGQGVNYARGTWHHPLIALDAEGDFLVIDRGARSTKADCEEQAFSAEPGVWVNT